jgi:hypothetical protein
MSIISQKLPSLIGGVSQQPDETKRTDQLRVCDNFLPDATFGLAKRPQMKFINTMTNGDQSAAWFDIERDDEEKYIVQIARNGLVRVYDAQSGVEQPMNAQSAGCLAYLSWTTNYDIQLLTLNDYTLLLNRNVKVLRGSTTSPADTPYAIVQVAAVGYNTRYEVTVDQATTFFFNSTNVGTDRLSMKDIVDGLAFAINADANWLATVIGNTLYVRRANGAAFEIEGKGGTGGGALEVYKGKVATVSQLPKQFINNARIQVLASETSDGDSYWVKFTTTNGTSKGVGVWEETIAPGMINGFNFDTMPHVLVREANGTFTPRRFSLTEALATATTSVVTGVVTTVAVTYAQPEIVYLRGQTFWVNGGSGRNLRLRVLETNPAGQVTAVEPSRAGQGYAAANVVQDEWGTTYTISAVSSPTLTVDPFALAYWVDREIGDNSSNPFPSIVDKRIDGIGFFKNRLVLASGGHVLCSQAGDYFNMFASTAITLVDSDPIDIDAGSTKPLNFKHTMNSPKGLLLFSDNGQYLLETTTEAFSAKTAELNMVGSYDLLTRLSPVDLGGTLAFVSAGNRSASVYEASFTSDDNNRTKAAELTRLVPSYLPTDVRGMQASTGDQVLALHSYQEPGSLYLFKWEGEGSSRTQSAWFRWTFNGHIHFFTIRNGVLTVVLRPYDPPYTRLIFMSASLQNDSPTGPLVTTDGRVDTRLDFLSYNPRINYHAGSNTTRISLPLGAQLTGYEAEVVRIDAANPGYTFRGPVTYDAGAAVGDQYFVSVPGYQAGFRFAIGYQYISVATLPSFFVSSAPNTRGEVSRDTRNIPTVHRLYVSSYNSGSFDIEVASFGRNLWTKAFEQTPANLYGAGQMPLLRNVINSIPVFARGNQTTVTIKCPYSFPTAITSIEWEGDYSTFGHKRI